MSNMGSPWSAEGGSWQKVGSSNQSFLAFCQNHLLALGNGFLYEIHSEIGSFKVVSKTQYLEENIVNPVDGEASPVASPVAFHLRDLHAVARVALEVIKIRAIFAQSTS